MRLRTIRRIFREGGPLTLLERAIVRARERFYVWGGRSYGLREALLFPDGFQVDLWTRYSRAAAVLDARLPPPGPWRILEIGAGGPGLSGFMRDAAFWSRINLVVADRDPWLMAGVPSGRAVVADALSLPFPDGSFDAVLAVDLLEHLPPKPRGHAASEMRRLARRLIVCHCPVEGEAESFRGGWADRRFAEEFGVRYAKDPPGWTVEHIAAGHPTPRELRHLFPGCSLSGDQNCDVWLRYMLAGEPRTGRASRFLTGLRYWSRWRRQDGRAPFRSALLVLDQHGPSEPGKPPA